MKILHFTRFLIFSFFVQLIFGVWSAFLKARRSSDSERGEGWLVIQEKLRTRRVCWSCKYSARGGREKGMRNSGLTRKDIWIVAVNFLGPRLTRCRRKVYLRIFSIPGPPFFVLRGRSGPVYFFVAGVGVSRENRKARESESEPTKAFMQRCRRYNNPSACPTVLISASWRMEIAEVGR